MGYQGDALAASGDAHDLGVGLLPGGDGLREDRRTVEDSITHSVSFGDSSVWLRGYRER